jgi:SAM-dependent methyltransferase
MQVKKLTECRACGSKALTPVLSIISGGTPAFLADKSGKYADFVLCDPSRDARACGLLQRAHKSAAASPAPSGSRATTRDFLRAAATESLELISGRDSIALDIGCNDGSLLSYYPRWVERCGADPCAHVDRIGKWARTAKAAFPSSEFDAVFGDGKFDIITAISLFEFCDDPRGFLSAVKSRLVKDGVFTLETLYAPAILTSNNFEAMQAGVEAVYSLSVLEWLVRESGLKIVKGALTTKEGGSVRLFITHQDNHEFDFDPWIERLAKLWDKENALAMRAIQPYQAFEQRVGAIREEFVKLLEGMAERGECAHILGADAQAAALLDWAGPAADVIIAAVDGGAAKAGARLGGRGLRVISETECRAEDPDVIIAPVRFKREILERWREEVLLGMRIVFATPTPHVVSSMNLASEYAKSIARADNAAGADALRAILALAGGPRLIADNADHPNAASQTAVRSK